MTTEINRDVEARILGRQWFYRFQLPGGRTTDSYLPADVLPIHDTRERMMFQVLETEFAGRVHELRCADLACHEGYFAHKLALAGCGEVVGVDARAEHVEHAGLIREAFRLQNLSFRVGDLQRLAADDLGSFDLTLLFGVLYHLENVVGVLRLAQAVTRRLCLVETQIAPDLSGVTEWGAQGFTKQIVGCLAIVDESAELAAGNREANTTPITLFPSLPGLLWLLRAVGFREASVVTPPADAYEQFARGQRVVVAAYN